MVVTLEGVLVGLEEGVLEGPVGVAPPPIGAVEAPSICCWTVELNWPDMPLMLKNI